MPASLGGRILDPVAVEARILSRISSCKSSGLTIKMKSIQKKGKTKKVLKEKQESNNHNQTEHILESPIDVSSSVPELPL